MGWIQTGTIAGATAVQQPFVPPMPPGGQPIPVLPPWPGGPVPKVSAVPPPYAPLPGAAAPRVQTGGFAVLAALALVALAFSMSRSVEA